jgi:peptide deformylase
MIRNIVRDAFFLQMPSSSAGKEDLPAVYDLIDTFRENRNRCVGMAANMIGIRKNIIIFLDGKKEVIMINPKLLSGNGKYEIEEGCLSLTGKRKTERFEEIVVEYENLDFQKHRKKYSGYTAQIIQHELDHCRGILI